MRDLSIRARLVAGFLVIVSLIAATGYITLAALNRVSADYEQALEEYAGRALVATGMKVDLLNAVRAQKNFLLRGDPRYLATTTQEMERLARKRAALGEKAVSEAEQALLERFEAALETLDQAFLVNVSVRDAQGAAAADQALRGRAEATLAVLDEFVALVEARAREEREDAAAAMRRAWATKFALVAAIALAAIGVGLALSLSITRPLGRVRSQIRALAKNGVAPSGPAVEGRSEVAEIARAFYDAVQRAALLREVESRSRRLATLSARVARAQEQERERIARELHDGLGQALTAVKLELSAAHRQTSDIALAQRLVTARELIEGTLEELRRLVLDLRPPALETLGLVAALQSYIREFRARSGLAVEFAVEGMRERLSFETEAALYRIAQEALTNTHKHAQATRAEVHLSREGDHVVLAVADDGAGFDVAAATTADSQLCGLGLLSMESRVEELGGSFSVTSAPGQGATVRVCVPARPAGEPL